MLRFFSVEKSGDISSYGQPVSDRDFHTCLFVWYSTTIGRRTAQVTSMRGTCGHMFSAMNAFHSEPSAIQAFIIIIIIIIIIILLYYYSH